MALIAAGAFLWTHTHQSSHTVAARAIEAVEPADSFPTVGHHADAPTAAMPEAPPRSIAISGMLGLLPNALRDASTEHQATAARLAAFARDGDLTALAEVSGSDVESLAHMLLDSLGTEAVEHLLQEGLRLPPGYLKQHPEPARAVADIYEAVKGAGDPTTARTLVFTDRCEDNGSVTGNVHVIPSGARRIYAAFENAGGLHGLDRVFAVWRNPADAKMVFAEYEPVHAGTAFNYVWLDLNEGWPAGHYEVALYHPQRTTELLAARSFNVR
jgi:hypothetical protein